MQGRTERAEERFAFPCRVPVELAVIVGLVAEEGGIEAAEQHMSAIIGDG